MPADQIHGPPPTAEYAPNREVEEKYLLASEVDAENLVNIIRVVYPESKPIAAYDEDSYFYPPMPKYQAKQLAAFIVRFRDDGQDFIKKFDDVPDEAPVAMRFRREHNRNTGTDWTLTFKASSDPMHDTDRWEVEMPTSDRYMDGLAANGIKPESAWHSLRRVYEIDDQTKIDIEEVSGYGWKAEIEGASVEKVREVAGRLGLKALTPKVLKEMYALYLERYPDGQAKFDEGDWQEVEARAGEPAVRNVVKKVA